jgi:hypothetical protein
MVLVLVLAHKKIGTCVLVLEKIIGFGYGFEF